MKHRIYIKNEQKCEAYTPAMRSFIKAAVTDTLAYEEFEDACEVSVTLTDNGGIQKLNKEFRNIDKETDVLSFPQFDGEYSQEDLTDGCLALGDIIISVQKAREQADTLGHGLNEEIAFLCVHSVLHLLGYDHVTSQEDEDEMFSRQREIMKKFRQQ